MDLVTTNRLIGYYRGVGVIRTGVIRTVGVIRTGFSGKNIKWILLINFIFFRNLTTHALCLDMKIVLNDTRKSNIAPYNKSNSILLIKIPFY